MSTTERSPRNNNISRIAKGLLAVSGRKQGELAEVLGLSDSGMSRRLKGGEWSVDDIDRLAQFFDVPLSTFFKRPEDLFTPSEQGKDVSIWDNATYQVSSDPIQLAFGLAAA